MLSQLRTSLLFLLLVVSCFSFAQKSLVTGKAKSYVNQTLRAFVYTDFLTLTETQIAKTVIDSTGNFKLFIPLNYTQLVHLRTETSSSSFYAEPAKNYFVSIPPLEAREIATLGVRGYAPLKINSSDSLELNNLIAKFENYMDDFYQHNLALLARKGIKKEAEKFKTSMEKRFYFSKNNYFKNYIKYKMATLEAAGGYAERYLFRNYFSASIEYTSLEYMQFFSQTFTKHLEQLSGTAKGAEIENIISVKRNYMGAMLAILKADTLFKNDTLRELLLLKGLNEFYYRPKMNKQNILSLLTYIEKNGKGLENKKIAGHTLLLLTKMEVGSKSPSIELYDQQRKLIKLTDFKGKYVYLDFWATWCLPCLQEMKLKQTLKDKYGNEIIFMSISLDRNFALMKSYLDKNKNLNSIFLFGGEDESIKENYNVKSVPSYYLIDRDGDVLKSPAKQPSENIESVFQELLKRK